MLDELCGGHIADIGEGDPVAKGGHAVSTAGTGVSAGQRRELKVRSNVVHPALHIGQGQAKKYDKFNNKWIEVKYILNLIPGDFNTLEKEILVVKNIEKEDDDNYYFLKIKEMRHEQTLAPLDYVRDEITLILKNKKKLQFENDLEKQINEEGVRKKYVKIY